MSCQTRLSVDELVDYFAGDLPASDSERIDLHLLSCSDCTARASALAPLLTALREHIPYVISTAGLQALERRHLRIARGEARAGARNLVPFPDGADLLVIKLAAPLSEVTHLDCELRTPDGHPILAIPEAPFDAQEGSVQLACQRHFLERFAATPEFTITLYRTGVAGPRVPIAEYTIHHS
jgi:hypothetical protein